MLVASTGTPQGPFGFVGAQGYQEDVDSGLKLLGHRYYDASTGRFLTRDPAKDGRNWYSYCENEPTAVVDPDGQMAAAAAAISLFVPGLGEAVLIGIGVVAIGVGVYYAITVSPKAPPYVGTPGDTVVGPHTSRRYGPDGYPEVDRDHNKGGGHPEDESHDWDPRPDGPPERQPGRPPQPGDPPPPWNNPGSPYFPGPSSFGAVPLGSGGLVYK